TENPCVPGSIPGGTTSSFHPPLYLSSLIAGAFLFKLGVINILLCFVINVVTIAFICFLIHIFALARQFY
ncbi:MAG: hypothetical protein Q4E58_01800, partial [Prevotellaceae bacterium]|nr:hypothetical protein [Prevotellaceae bacterium]